jgi:hypothetical protein
MRGRQPPGGLPPGAAVPTTIGGGQPPLNPPIKLPGIAANCERWQPAKARRDSELAAGLIAHRAGTWLTAENLKNRVQTLFGLFSTVSGMGRWLKPLNEKPVETGF